MQPPDSLLKGRASYEAQAWSDAYARLTAADRASPLGPDDLWRLATAAYLTGKDNESIGFWTRIYDETLRTGNTAVAARSTFWLIFMYMTRGEMARAGGWIARGHRLLERVGHDCVEAGYLLIPAALKSVYDNHPSAKTEFARVFEIGERFHDADLMTLAMLGQGQALIRLGDTARGVRFLDEAMLTVTGGGVSPMATGIVYCGVIRECAGIFDLSRAREWTAALDDWCRRTPDLVPFRGECLAHRAEIMRYDGDWSAAIDEARQACTLLTSPPGDAAAGPAYYQLAELHRLRGEFNRAEAAYRQASEWGRQPEPGLALLRLAQGRLDTAEASIRRSLRETEERLSRCRFLPAFVDIMLACGDVPAARSAVDDLSQISGALGAPLLKAVAAHAEGAVCLAEGDIKEALMALRRASSTWQTLAAPYDLAKTRILIGIACRELGDEENARLEYDAARRELRRIGAVYDLTRLDAPAKGSPAGNPHGLTERQQAVLRLVASGMTNKAIAAELHISARTVDRHLSNIFDKINVTTRAAATAYAFQRGLL